jgi:predicted CXXCH cytochrome family protein
LVIIKKGGTMRAVLVSFAVILLAAAPVFSEETIPSIKKDCNLCHKLNKKGTLVRLKVPMSQLCLDCHSERTPPGEHVVDVKATMKVRYLPLDRKGRITCVTCHEPHGMTGKVKMLRARPSELCNYCHKK